MNSSTFQSATVATTPPDPRKHVNYTEGMVLGVDDFVQEFAYLTNRDQWLARDTIGYGTVSGLHVALTPKNGDTEVSVSPGVAINPRGQFIAVNPRQCARLNAWLNLAATQDQLAKKGLNGKKGSLTAYVVLCYRDCPTDNLPVPGEPCRCDDETMAPSRVLDDFRLELTLTPPPQNEEDAVRDFVAWLREIKVVDFDATAADLAAFLDALRAAVGGTVSEDSPPQSPPDFLLGSPPAGLRIPQHEACEWLRAAMRLWVTELRPIYQARCAPRAVCGCTGDCGCHGTGTEPDDLGCDCLLLAELTLSLSGGQVATAALSEEHRPFLVHLRLLQEMLLCGPCVCAEKTLAHTFATVFAVDDSTLRLWIHHPVPLKMTGAALALWLDGVVVPHFTLVPHGGTNVFDLLLPHSPPHSFAVPARVEVDLDVHRASESGGKSLADALREDGYTYLDYADPLLRVYGVAETVPSPKDETLLGDVTGEPFSNRISNLQGHGVNASTPKTGDVLQFDGTRWTNLPKDGTLLGDVSGKLSSNQISNLQGHGVSASAPNAGDVLQFDGTRWVPKAPAASNPAPVTGPYVDHPPNAPAYSIVAAGILSSDGQATATYNGLKANVLSTSSPPNSVHSVLLRFNTFQFRSNQVYIVKATPVLLQQEIQRVGGLVPLALADLPATSFYVTKINADGIAVAWTVRPEQKVSFMIEVSQYTAA